MLPVMTTILPHVITIFCSSGHLAVTGYVCDLRHKCWLSGLVGCMIAVILPSCATKPGLIVNIACNRLAWVAD